MSLGLVSANLNTCYGGANLKNPSGTKVDARTFDLSRENLPSRKTSFIDDIGLRPDMTPCSSSVR